MPSPKGDSLPLVLAPSLKRKFSGVTASLIAVVPAQAERIAILALGHRLPERVPQAPWRSLFSLLWRNRPLIWHARRNSEMLLGIVLRHLLRFPLKLVWTSAAQRHHTGLTRFYYHRMDALIATTDKAASYLDRPATVVRHGVDASIFYPSQSHDSREQQLQRYGISARYVMGAFGRVRPSKGSDVYIDALCRILPQHPDWHAVVIGQTTSQYAGFEQSLRDKVEQAGLSERIHFIGMLEDFAEIPKWYRSLDLVVCASREEGFGLTCLEAMASSVPVIGSQAGAYPEIIETGKDGWVVPCGDTDGMASAMQAAVSDPERLKVMGAAAFNKASQQYTIQSEAAGIEAVYRAVMGHH